MGLLLAGVIYLIIEAVKLRKKNLVTSAKLDSSLDNLGKNVDRKFDDVNNRIDLVNDKVDTQYELLNKKIESGPETFMNRIKEDRMDREQDHFEKIIDQFSQAPRLHRVLKLYRERIGCDHIFMGTFHNGSTSISGIPYCKFDVIAEKFKPGYNNIDTREYTSIYNNSDVVVHDNLPILLSQEDYVYFKIEEDGSSELEEIDDILYMRCVKHGVKQFALNLLRDYKMNPIGFVGCVDFDYDNLNFKELNNCAKALEEIYNN